MKENFGKLLKYQDNTKSNKGVEPASGEVVDLKKLYKKELMLFPSKLNISAITSFELDEALDGIDHFISVYNSKGDNVSREFIEDSDRIMTRIIADYDKAKKYFKDILHRTKSSHANFSTTGDHEFDNIYLQETIKNIRIVEDYLKDLDVLKDVASAWLHERRGKN